MSGVLISDYDAATFVEDHVPTLRGATIDRWHDGSLTIRAADGTVAYLAAGTWLAAVQG